MLYMHVQGKEPFVYRESLEQLHRFLFLLGITHVLYSCATVVLAMVNVKALYFCLFLALALFDLLPYMIYFLFEQPYIIFGLPFVQIYSWRKRESQGNHLGSQN